VILVGGEAELDGERLDLFTLYVLRPGHEARLSSARGGRAMLLGGEAFATRRYVFWNFVSSSRDRINQAKEDWKAQRFDLIPGDDEEFIPLPEVPLTVSYP
jgi:redox-sensitive bicupin YhaK (pirin superfamily)